MSTPDVTITQMSLRQLSEFEYILLGDLRDVLEEASNEQNRKWLVALVDVLLQTLPREFEIRERGGYFREIMVDHPEMSVRIERLRRQHQQICTELRTLADLLNSRSCFREQSESLKQNLAEWSELVYEHNRTEERLIQQAYQQDLGGGD